MTHASTNLRLVRLALLIRVRRLGRWPWIALLLWAAAATLQEPTLLRAFGANLSWQGVWSGATILLGCLLALGEPLRPRYLLLEVIQALVLTAAVATLQAAIAFAADWLGHGELSWHEAARSWTAFVLAWTPASVALAPGPLRLCGAHLLAIVPIVFSLGMASTCWRDGADPRLVAGVALVAAGAVLASAPARRAGAPCA